MTQREQYIKQWAKYTDQLYSVAFDLSQSEKSEDTDMGCELTEYIQRIKQIIDRAGMVAYPDGKNKIILDNG